MSKTRGAVGEWDDSAREAVIHQHENLFRQWQASGLRIWEWIAANRTLIDQTAGR
jgi:hypothetical protein